MFSNDKGKKLSNITSASIKKNKIVFRPGKRIRNVLKLAEYKKVQ